MTINNVPEPNQSVPNSNLLDQAASVKASITEDSCCAWEWPFWTQPNFCAVLLDIPDNDELPIESNVFSDVSEAETIESFSSAYNYMSISSSRSSKVFIAV